MGLIGKIMGKEKIRFPSSGDVEREEARQERREQKRAERTAYREEFRKARIARMRTEGKRAGGTTWSDRLENFSKSVGPAPTKQRRSRPVKYYSSYSPQRNYNPLGSMFDTGMNYGRPHKKTMGGKRFAVIGGKAYPIAGKKKGKRKKKSPGFGIGGFDIADNWGFMK